MIDGEKGPFLQETPWDSTELLVESSQGSSIVIYLVWSTILFDLNRKGAFVPVLKKIGQNCNLNSVDE